MRWKVGLVTASDRGFRGEREDTCAQVIRELVEEELNGDIIDYRIVPDEIQEIAAALIEMSDYYQVDLLVTTGGVGMGPRDVTPEAAMKVIERLAPGYSERMRAALSAKSADGLMFRGMTGIRGKTLIVNLPGTPEGVLACLGSILRDLPAALQALSPSQDGHAL